MKALRYALWTVFFIGLIAATFSLGLAAALLSSPAMDFVGTPRGGLLAGLLGLILVILLFVILVINYALHPAMWKRGALAYILLLIPSFYVLPSTRAYAIEKILPPDIFSLHEAWIIGTILVIAALICVITAAVTYASGSSLWKRCALAALGITGLLLTPYVDYALYGCHDSQSCSTAIAEEKQSLAACKNYFAEEEACLQKATIKDPSVSSCKEFTWKVNKNTCVTRVAQLTQNPVVCDSIEWEPCPYLPNCPDKRDCLDVANQNYCAI